MKKNDDKTNALRILDKCGAKYIYHVIETNHALSGVEAAKALKMPAEKVFKTLVTISKSRSLYVFVIPCAKELNLKKAAKAVGEKSVEMLKHADLLPFTGYVHGGCSPVGMKKSFTTVIDSSAEIQKSIVISAGKIGHHAELELTELEKAIKFSLADVAE